MLLVVWIAVPVLCLVVLAGLAYGVLGALQRLGREAQALEREVAPLLAQAQAVQARAADRSAVPSGEQRVTPS
ncbi:hypothetical protein [Blastococcus sp. SYSU D00813]